MSNQEEIDRLLQKEWRENLIPNLGQTSWITAYIRSFQDALNCRYIYLAFVPTRHVKTVLESYQWDIYSFDFRPYCQAENVEESEAPTKNYDRYGFKKFGIEPFVIERSFHDLKPLTTELSEEFRLFHNLYFDNSTSKYLRFDDAGNESPVVKFSQDRVEARRQEIRQFMSAKDMALVIYFEQMYGSIHTLDELGIAEHQLVERSSLVNYRFLVEECDGLVTDNYRARSWLLGKAIVTGTAEHNHFGTRIENKQRQVKFKIGIDENDQPIMCSPKGISHSASKKVIDSAGKTVVATYLTPVFFKRSVLDRYRKEPSKYEIEDGYMSCGGLWGLRMDNNHKDFVIVFLGRLRDDLPVSEQSHWEYHNVPPYGHLSATAFRRTVLAEWAEPEDTALVLKQSFDQFQNAWHVKHGWYLFLPLSEADSHHVKTLHRPSTNEPRELSEIAVSLSKLLAEAINKDALLNHIRSAHPGSNRSLPKKTFAILKEYLKLNNYGDLRGHVEYVEKVQLLRSASATHRTDNMTDAYDQVMKFFSLDSKTTGQVADEIFTTLTAILDSLRAHFCPDESD